MNYIPIRDCHGRFCPLDGKFDIVCALRCSTIDIRIIEDIRIKFGISTSEVMRSALVFLALHDSFINFLMDSDIEISDVLGAFDNINVIKFRVSNDIDQMVRKIRFIYGWNSSDVYRMALRIYHMNVC